MDATTICKSNLDSIPYVKICLQNLYLLKNSPQLVFDMKNDVFGIPLDEDSDEALHSLRIAALSVSEKECLAEILLRLITGVVDVIEHQMKEYIEGSLANIPPAIAAQTLSAPAHNMFAEQTLGLADHLMRKAPNITIGFVDGKVKSKINKTLNWLSNKTENEQGNIVKFCIKQGRKSKAFANHMKNMLPRCKMKGSLTEKR